MPPDSLPCDLHFAKPNLWSSLTLTSPPTGSSGVQLSVWNPTLAGCSSCGFFTCSHSSPDLQPCPKGVFKFLWFETLPKFQQLRNKGKETTCPGVLQSERGRGIWPVVRGTAAFLRTHHLSLPLVLEGMEEAEADCALAFAEAQRWVEVSAFSPLLSARVGRSCHWTFSRLPGLSRARRVITSALTASTRIAQSCLFLNLENRSCLLRSCFCQN